MRRSSSASSGDGSNPSSAAEAAARARQRRQGVHPAPAAVERHRLRRAQPFPQRMALDQRLDLRQRLPRRPTPSSASARSSSASRRALSQRSANASRSGVSSPSSGRPRQSASAASIADSASACVAALARVPRRLDVRREPLHIGRPCLEGDAVARSAADEHLPATRPDVVFVLEQPAQLRDETLQRRDCRLRRALAPQLVDQVVAGHGPAWLGQEQGEQQSPLAAAERHR